MEQTTAVEDTGIAATHKTVKTERSIETILAMECLSKLEEGDVCQYRVLAEAMGKDPQGDGYGYVVTARKALERENDCVFEAVPNEGIRRCTPREIVNKGGKDLRHVKRHTRAAIRRQGTLVPVERQAGLSNVERTKFLAQLSHLGVLHQMLKPTAVRRIDAAVEIANRLLPPSDTLKMFTNGNKATKAEEKPADG